MVLSNINNNLVEELTKAEMLLYLRDNLKNARVEKLYYFDIQEWKVNQKSIIDHIKNYFDNTKIVVRSSSLCEDSLMQSYAGCFHSELNVNVEDVSIIDAINKVILSYKEKDISEALRHKVLIQEFTQDVAVSGVVFTRQLETNAPYYVINYDEVTGQTDTVTGGLEGRVIYISRFYRDYCIHKKWEKLLNAVVEIENFFPKHILDIEFAIQKDGHIVVFQVRPLVANNKSRDLIQDDMCKGLVEDMVKKFQRCTLPISHLAGSRTILGDMPDWNPSEIIGSRPNTLDYSLYSFVITDEAWHIARESLGYCDVFPSELMLSFGKKPYIDVRSSFNSMIPASLPFDLREKLIMYYLDKFDKNPEYQDKVEFEILWTCYDFRTQERLEVLLDYGFTKFEIKDICSALFNLTQNIIKNANNIFQEDVDMVHYLTARSHRVIENYRDNQKSPWKTIDVVYNLLQICKRYGTVPFSRQARLGFIAKNFMISLESLGVIDSCTHKAFLNTIRTVASEFSDDAYLLNNKTIGQEDFLKKYGHLRAGTYDITSLRYDSVTHLFEGAGIYDKTVHNDKGNIISKQQYEDINKTLKKHHFCIEGNDLLNFVKQATQNREYIKFEFTKNISEALELIVEAGEMLGFTREDMCHLDLPTLFKFRNPEKVDYEYAKKVFNLSIQRHKKERAWYDGVVLPPVISSVDDFYYVQSYKSIPNFITSNCVKGSVVTYDQIKRDKNVAIHDKIVLLENADPGFDWIFAKMPAGLITKYGGVASHIAIRCAEFNIAAAIGCGDVLYDYLKKFKMLRLDCEKEIVEPVFGTMEK